MVKHYHSRYHFSYHTSGKHHFYTTLGVIIGLALLFLIAFKFLTPSRGIEISNLSFLDIIRASYLTIYRLVISYTLALITAIPIVIFTSSFTKLERFLLPVYDILQSIPVLAFFPVIVLIFIKLGFYDGAAIFVLFVAMVWNLVFSMIAGLKTIPEDIHSAATVFGSKGLSKLWMVTLPAIFPFIVTGSLLAWGQAWAIVIVAEALHNYIPDGRPSQDLFGLGSLLANSAYRGQTLVFLASLAAMIILISLLNFFVWQKLLHLSERYKFD